MIINCPSGLAGEIRGMKGREAQAFVDPVLVRSNGSMDQMLANCFLSVSDPGPYALTEKGTVPWRDALVGDRFHALMEIRTLTFGADYDFNVKCQSCEKQYGWELLLSDLPRRPLPPESFEKIRNGDNRFQVELPDDHWLTFKLSTGVEETQITKLRGGAGSTRKLGPVDAVWVQALAIHEGQGEGAKLLPGAAHGIRKFLEDLDYGALLDVIKGMQDHDCGVETEIETICEICGWQQWIELPFQRSFFEQRRKKTKA